MVALPVGVKKSLDETRVDYVRVGNSGLRVSVPIIGCMSIGNPEWADWVVGPDKALPLLKAAYDRGVNTVRVPTPNILKNPITLDIDGSSWYSGIQPIFIPMETPRG